MYNRHSAPAAPAYGRSYGTPATDTPAYGHRGNSGTIPYNGAATASAQGVSPQNNAPTPMPGQQVRNPMPATNRGQNSANGNGAHAPGTIPYKPSEKSAHANGRQNYSGERQGESEPMSSRFISGKICKANAKNKVVDFSSRLYAAKVEDFANVHGCGGNDHAWNSTVAVTICDYTKGTGEASVSASYNIDAEIMEILYHAAMDARLGKLTASGDALVSAAAVALHELQRWEISGQQQPVSVVPFSELVQTGQTMGNAIQQNNPVMLANASGATLSDLRRWAGNRKQCPSAGVPLRDIYKIRTDLTNALANQDRPLFEYSAEKNNPHAEKDSPDGLVPVSKLYIAYTPTRKGGEPSRYPWFIQIENFRAPLNTRPNGASSHDASRAVDRKSVSINVSADDFATAMVAVKRYIRIWEMVATIPVVRKGLTLLEKIKAAKSNK